MAVHFPAGGATENIPLSKLGMDTDPGFATATSHWPYLTLNNIYIKGMCMVVNTTYAYEADRLPALGGVSDAVAGCAQYR